MSEQVDVSVVMSVYNGAECLRQSVESILSQEGVVFEFIIVNDGSTDESPAILEEYAKKDGRIRLIHQENQGLTRSLITGCSQARGKYIARQDSDDLSFAGRLHRLARELDAYPQVVMVFPSAVMIGPKSELLAEPPSPSYHGSVMFRRGAYGRIGGYCRQFRAAQDIDLRLRLAEVGEIRLLPELLYAWRAREGSISCYSPIQKKLARLAVAASDVRRSGGDEHQVLEKAARISSELSLSKRAEPGTGYYFIGRCLTSQGDPRAFSYLWASCCKNPFSLRGWLALAEAFVLTRSGAGRDVTLSGLIPRQH